MKRIWYGLFLLFLVAGLFAPAGAAQSPAGPAPAPPAIYQPPGTVAATEPEYILYFWDFEDNDGGFTSTLDWEWGTYSWVGDTCDSSNYPPPNAYSGTNVWATVVNTCYNNLDNNSGYDTCINDEPWDDSILSFTIDLTDVTTEVQMSWWEWFDLFLEWDWAEVYANGDVLFQHCGTPFVEPTVWEQQVVDLTPYAGGMVTIEFHMMASSVVNHAGWYIDDLMIAAEDPEPVVWDKTIDGLPWTPDISITRQTSDTIVVEEVLHLTPLPPLGPTTVPAGEWQPNLPVAPIPPARTPETVGGTPPPHQALPPGAPRPLQDAGLLYLTNLSIGNTTFAVYDPATDSWTTLTPFETGCQMAVSTSGQLYAYNYTAGSIDVYDPDNDTWSAVMAAPPGAAGQMCNLEITAEGELLYTEANGTTLWYTSGGAWNTLALPFTTNAMGDYDPTADQYVIGELWTTNAHMIDVHDWTITDFFSSVPNNEWARSGVVLGNRYYFEAGGSNMHSFDLSDPASPPLDHGVSPGWYTSAAGDRANAVIYSASLDSAQLNLFDPAAGTITPLTGYNDVGGHSSLAFVPPQQAPVYAQIESWDPAHLQLVDWSATGGDVTVEPDRLVWTGLILVPETITLTKWFHVEPCTWTQTILWEELWLDDVELEQRPVLIDKLAPVLWIDSTYDPLACPGMPAQFVLGYGNLGGNENLVTVRNEFPPEAPFAFSEPPPDDVDPNGLWAEWWIGDLPMGAEGFITVTVAITDTALPGDLIYIYDWIIDHVGEPADMTEIAFEVGEPDIAVDPLMLWAELCPEAMAEQALWICNNGDCPLDWAIDEMTPTTWLSEDPLAGTIGMGECQTVTVTFDSTGVAPGEYDADLGISSNDPDDPEVFVPVTMTVLQPAEILTVTTVITDLTVDFDATVVGEAPLSYTWNFGDGITDTVEDPIHTYAEGGCYTVTLDAWNDCDGDTWSELVCVEEPCEPVDILTVTTSIDGCMVDFAAELAGTAPFAYMWDFGAFGTSDAPTPTVDFEADGTYPYTLTAYNCGMDYWDTYAGEVTVACEVCEPVYGADFDWVPLEPGIGQDVTFTGWASGTEPITFTWDFGDGAHGHSALPTGISPAVGPHADVITHAYATTGTFTVTMTASNCETATMSVMHTITVVEEPACLPVEILTVTTEISGCAATFGAELDGTEPFAYMWDFGAFGTSTATTPYVDFGGDGTYPYMLTVYNCEGLYEDTYEGEVTVECGVCLPVTDTQFTWTPTMPEVGQDVTFTGWAQGSTPITFTWDFGDGTHGHSASPMGVSPAVGPHADVITHTYTAAGTYTVTLTATNCVTATQVVWNTVTVVEAVEEFAIYLPIITRNYTP